MRILFTWELGSGLGHLASMLPVARMFLQRGHTVALAVQDLSNISTLTEDIDEGLIWFQAPLWKPKIKSKSAPISFSEILFHTGFLDPNRLLGLVKGWLSLFDMFEPDLIVFDHSPVAILASHGLSMRRVSLGHGFFIPPNESPLPSFRNWENHSAQRLASSNDIALANTNNLLRILNRPVLAQLSDLYSLDRHFLKCFPELDHYSDRNNINIEYIGPCTITDVGARPHWPKRPGRKIFAYLKSNYEEIDRICTLLANSNHSIIVYCPGLSKKSRTKIFADNISISETPLNFNQTLKHCDLVINHSGLGTVISTLLSEVPQLNLPIFAEQLIVAKNMHKLGCSSYLLPEQVSQNFNQTIEKLLTDESTKQACLNFSQKYCSHNIEKALDSAVISCLELLREKL